MSMRMADVNAQPRHILIIKPSALGDIALALPALSSLRASFPQARITWLVRDEFAPLLEGAKDVDDVLLFDRKGLGKWWRHPKAFVSLLRFFGDLRKGRFDLVVDLQGLFRTAFFGWVTRSRRRIGMKDSRELAGLFYTNQVGQNDGNAHVIDYYHKVVAAAGCSTIVDKCNFAASPGWLARARQLLAEQGEGDYVVFVTGSAHPAKCWPIERFAALADRIDTAFGLPVVAVGGRGEKETVEKLRGLSRARVLDLAGRTDIGALAGVLSGARLVVSNDTGPGHIAVALGAPVIIIFGRTNPMRIAPYKKEHSFVAVDPEGRGRAIASDDPRHRIEEISVDSVFAEAAYHLAGTCDAQPAGPR
ncbi:MAG: glycosyltransferase family 9 protein [Phycisphaerae bacterium]|nr:glycosyltransferase family 9 protein [Phycisphaerae bacterium]